AGWTPPAHNEWLRVLFLGGFCSMAVFIGCQLRILFHIVNLYLKQRKFHLFVALMIFGSYLLDCIGIVPGLYPSYNWFLWGMLGCLITQGSDFYAPISPKNPVLIPLAHETQQGT
ncbi:MAG: hypothetical protein J5746_04365, partial [Victivallales bacterium]|nr:hypothetical protein [Victivallales bacterium]